MIRTYRQYRPGRVVRADSYPCIGYGSAGGCANHVLRRVKKAVDEYCDDEDDVREIPAELGYIS